MRFLMLILILMLGIELGHTVIEQVLIVADASEVGAAAQVHRLDNAVLQMTVGAFNRTVLVGDSPVVSRRLQPIVLTQVVIQARQRFGLLPTQISIGRTQAIGAMLLWSPAAGKQGILQSFG